MEWVAYRTKVIGLIPEGDQKGHKYTCFARSALCTWNLYDLYALDLVFNGVYTNYYAAVDVLQNDLFSAAIAKERWRDGLQIFQIL